MRLFALIKTIGSFLGRGLWRRDGHGATQGITSQAAPPGGCYIVRAFTFGKWKTVRLTGVQSTGFVMAESVPDSGNSETVTIGFYIIRRQDVAPEHVAQFDRFVQSQKTASK